MKIPMPKFTIRSIKLAVVFEPAAEVPFSTQQNMTGGAIRHHPGDLIIFMTVTAERILLTDWQNIRNHGLQQ